MEVTYRKNLSGSYMCVEEEGQLIEPYEVQMLEQYQVPCLLRMRTVLSEGKRRYLYDISGKQQITDYFSGKKIGYDMLRMFLFSVYDACSRLSEYLLREEGLCLEIEYIYVNLEDGSLQFTYLPFYEKNLPAAFQEFMEQLLRKIDHQDSAAVELGYQIYQLCTGDNVNIGRLLEAALERQACEMGETDAPETKGEAGGGKRQEEEKPAQELPKPRKREAMEWLEKYLPGICGTAAGIKKSAVEVKRVVSETCRKFMPDIGKPVQRPKKRRHREKEVFPEMYERDPAGKAEDVPPCPTEILGVRHKEPVGKLAYHGVHQCGDILIEGDCCLLGKNSEQVDGVILADGVSRLHARITRREEDYFIEDLNSTNGTFLNDVMLEYRQVRQLKPKDKIRFGVEEYIFL